MYQLSSHVSIDLLVITLDLVILKKDYFLWLQANGAALCFFTAGKENRDMYKKTQIKVPALQCNALQAFYFETEGGNYLVSFRTKQKKLFTARICFWIFPSHY